MSKSLFYFLPIILVGLHLTPVTYAQNNNSLLERESLFGHIWGKDRLEEYGIVMDVIYTGEYFSNVRGGINTHDAREYRGDFSLFAELDTSSAGLWDDGMFYLHVQEQHGHGITTNHVGDFQVLSNIDADDFKQISELWYAHSFLDETLWIKLGKMEANTDFAFVDYGVEFINSSPGFSPTIPLVTYPDADLGVVVGIQPTDWFSVNIGVFQGNPNGGRSIGNAFEGLEGPMVIVEPAFHYHINGLDGHFRVGGWWNNVEFDRLDGSGRISDSEGLYLTLDQSLWNESEDDVQGIGVFAHAGFSDDSYFEAELYFGGGLQWTGALDGRDRDIAGLGVFHVEFSDEAGLIEGGETVIELFYKWQATGWMSIKPDIQYITNPGGVGNDDALAIGVRWDIVF